MIEKFNDYLKSFPSLAFRFLVNYVKYYFFTAAFTILMFMLMFFFLFLNPDGSFGLLYVISFIDSLFSSSTGTIDENGLMAIFSLFVLFFMSLSYLVKFIAKEKYDKDLTWSLQKKRRVMFVVVSVFFFVFSIVGKLTVFKGETIIPIVIVFYILTCCALFAYFLISYLQQKYLM